MIQRIYSTKSKELVNLIKEQPATSQPPSEPNYLVELVKYEYTRNARIERLMNPAKSFPIEQSYINLAIVTTKEQQEREKQLRDAQHSDAIMNTFEDIYGTKTTIDIKDIFETCKIKRNKCLCLDELELENQHFVDTFAYQWATAHIGHIIS